jgi:hypothetical protein
VKAVVVPVVLLEMEQAKAVLGDLMLLAERVEPTVVVETVMAVPVVTLQYVLSGLELHVHSHQQILAIFN